MRRKNTCSRCGNKLDREGQRWCKSCHAKNMKEHRKKKKQMLDNMFKVCYN